MNTNYLIIGAVFIILIFIIIWWIWRDTVVCRPAACRLPCATATTAPVITSITHALVVAGATAGDEDATPDRYLFFLEGCNLTSTTITQLKFSEKAGNTSEVGGPVIINLPSGDTGGNTAPNSTDSGIVFVGDCGKRATVLYTTNYNVGEENGPSESGNLVSVTSTISGGVVTFTVTLDSIVLP